MTRSNRPFSCSALLSFLLLAGTVEAAQVRVLRRSSVPEHLGSLVDVRWAPGGAVYLLSFKPPGVSRVDLRTGEARVVEFQLPRPPRFLAMRLAAAGDRVVVGSAVRGLAWWNRADRTTGEKRFGSVTDLDVQGDRLVVLGLRFADGTWAPEGGVGWLGVFAGDDQVPLEPVLKMRDERTVRDYVNCGSLELGAARFLASGRVVIATGVEPGIHLLNRSGRLVRTWRTDEFLSDCSMTDAEAEALAYQDARAAWSNQRRLLDDLIPLPDGFGAVVRYRHDDRIRWDLLRYRERGTTFERIPLPFDSDSNFARLKADAEGSDLVFLLVDHGWKPGRARIAEPLIIARIEP